MHCKVKLLRSRGIRRMERDILSDAGAEGIATLALCGAFLELKLSAGDDSQQKPIIPILYDAKLVSMHSGKMLFRGIERIGVEEGPQFLQEWSVMVLGA
jgi:hypothetical protein